MLCYTTVCLTDKRALNLTLLLQRPPVLVGIQGSSGETEGIPLSAGTKRQVVETGTIVKRIQMTGMFLLWTALPDPVKDRTEKECRF